MSQLHHVGGLSLALRHCIPRTTHIARHITTRTIIPSLVPSSLSSHRRSYHQHSSHSTFISSHSTSPSTSPSPSPPTISSIIRDLTTILKANYPRGFKNFFPKSEEEKKEEEKLASSQQSSGGSPPNNDNQPPNPDQDPNKKKSDKNKKKNDPFEIDLTPATSWLVLFSALSLGFYYYYNIVDTLNGQEITFQEFKHGMLELGKVERVDVIEKNRAQVHLRRDAENPNPQRYYFTIGSIDNFERQMEDAQRNIGIEPKDYIPIKYVAETHYASNITSFLTTMAMFGLIYWFMRNTTKAMGGMMGGGGKGGGGRNIFSIGKSPATIIKPGERTKVTFKDVAGLDEAKVEVMEFVEFLKNPGKFTKLGAKVPKGALLVGPPGTGKTLLAKATAGEASVPFFSISGSDFIEMFVGVGPSRVRDLFADARKSAPCIIFIDEIDAVGRARGKGSMGGGHDERENTLNQLLVEMDGFNPTEGIVVLAGTNRKDILDPALLRPGRFDRQIQVDIPDIKGRAQIFVVHLKPIKVDHDRVDLSQRLAALTPGFSGADIANLCNEAALIAARKGKEVVELIDFEAATDRIIGGMEKKFSVMTKQEKRLVAYHEAGHVVSGWFLEHANPVLKVTIVPRSNGALGFAQHLPKELSLYQQEQLLDMMCMTLGGRAAEQVFFDKISTGAADDLNKVTRLAQAQVSMYGMSKRLGNVSYQMDEQQFIKPFSEATAQTIDEEIRNLISISYERTLALIREKRTEVEKLAEKLLEVETVNHDMIVSILGPRPFTTDAYNEYRKNARKDAEEAQKAALADGVNTNEPNQNETNKKGGGPTLRPILDPV